MTFETIGTLPKSKGRWNIRIGGGHIVFVNEDPEVEPFMLLGGVELRRVVDAVEHPEVEMVQPLAEGATA